MKITIEEIEKWRSRFVIDEIRCLSQADSYNVGSVATLEKIDWLTQQLKREQISVNELSLHCQFLEKKVKELEAEREFLSKELIKSRKMIVDCNDRIDELEKKVRK